MSIPSMDDKMRNNDPVKLELKLEIETWFDGQY